MYQCSITSILNQVKGFSYNIYVLEDTQKCTTSCITTLAGVLWAKKDRDDHWKSYKTTLKNAKP